MPVSEPDAPSEGAQHALAWRVGLKLEGVVRLFYADMPEDKHMRADLQTLPDTHARWLRWIAVIVTGWLLFAHGCHGDEDNELFTSTLRLFTSAPASASAPLAADKSP